MQSLIQDADPLHKVSIIPRGPMGGATFALPEKDRTMFTKRYCIALLQVCFGGRIAEELFCDDISSGAQSDIEQATKIARQMVLTWGMSDQLGPISYGPDLGVKDAIYIMPTEREYSEKTAEDIDAEVKRIMDEAYKQAKQVIEENRDRLERHRPGPAQVRDPRRRRRQAHPGRRATWTSPPWATCWRPNRPRPRRPKTARSRSRQQSVGWIAPSVHWPGNLR